VPRVARRLSSSGIYHVMVRGINKQDIFLEYQDYRQYLTVMRRIKERSNCIVHCYCLMPNHVHLLLQIDGEDIGLVMKRIGSSYVRWYNNKYQRVGHLFQDRFLSKTVEEDSYFIKVLQYIHQNPVEGSLAPSCATYLWSSYNDYVTPKTAVFSGLVSTARALEMFDGLADFVKFNNEVNKEMHQNEYLLPASDEMIKSVLASLLGNRPIEDLLAMNRSERDYIIIKVREETRATYSRIANLCGLSLNVVKKACSMKPKS